jgi:hypothetical protein
VAAAALLVACTDYAGPIPGTEQTTASNEPSTPVTGGQTPSGGTEGGSEETPAGDPPPGDPPAGEAELVSFDRDVHPILVAKCGMCHEGAAPALPDHGASDVDVSFAATQGMSDGAPVYERILARASGEDPGGFMPPGYAGCEGPLGTAGCLSVEEFEIIEQWVEQGASNR